MAQNRPMPVDNLVQGVSQQAPQQRRATQCEDQVNCTNWPVEGVTPRPGFDVVAKLTTADLRDNYQFTIFRGSSERYQVFVGDGTIRVFNLTSGAACAVTIESGAASYLECTGIPRDVFRSTTAEDVTFIANTERVPAIDPTARSDARPHEALFYFKAGSYKTTYKITVIVGTTAYEWSYQTPDNSVEANEAYIKTDALCYALYNAMVTDPVNSVTTHLGFNIQRSGSLMRLWRTDSTNFDIDVSDGLGNTQLLGFKEKAPGFDKLPQGGFDGVILQVQGDVTAEEDDYYVQYVGRSATGVWEECSAPDIPISFDPETMPYRLVNTAPNTFVFGPSPWGDRLAGDEESAPDPSFVGKAIVDLAFDNARLLIMTQRGPVWSRTKNPYVFFPDTVQTRLATAPVDYEVKASKTIAIMRSVLQTDDDTFLWADGRQFRVSTAELPFTPESVAIKPASAYDFNPDVPPLPVGSSVLFAADSGPWSAVTDIRISDGRVEKETGLTNHAPEFVPSGLRWVEASDTAKKALLFAPTEPTSLYLYEWYLENEERHQSAWSRWKLPEANSEIVCGAFDRSDFYLVVHRPGGTWLLKATVSPYRVDGPGLTYLTRLDMRITEDAMAVSYSTLTGRTRFALPYLVTTDRPYVLAVRTGNELVSRGIRLPVAQSATEGGVTALYVEGDHTATELYGGYTFSASRTESEVYLHDQEGTYVHLDKLQVMAFKVSHARTANYRIEVLDPSGSVLREYPFVSRSRASEVRLEAGHHEASISLDNHEFRLRLVNDTHLPSAWQSAVWYLAGK